MHKYVIGNCRIPVLYEMAIAVVQTFRVYCTIVSDVGNTSNAKIKRHKQLNCIVDLVHTFVFF